MEMNKKITYAMKWSGLAEIIAKIITPLSNMILARLLTPNDFGVVATVNIIISFADMFTDAGFQKYIIQHDFKNKKDLFESINVAFWSNLVFSFILWGVIFIFRNEIASLVGNPGLGFVIAVACVILPITSFSSLQSAYFKRTFNFKDLFKIRIAIVLVPLVITVPLAIMTHSFWALIIGTIVSNLINAILLTYKSKWRPRLYYSMGLLKKMFSFSCWTLIEQFLIWLTAYIGTFIVGRYLNTYYVGIYKTSMTTVNQIMSIITSTTLPVLFAGLSRLQNDIDEFKNTFYDFQKMIALFVLPMSIGIYIYRDLITSVLLGKQWGEATDFIGLWAMMSGLTIVFGYYSSEVYRALGKPKLSVISQLLHLIVLIPVLIIFAQRGYHELYIARSLVRIEAILVDFIVLWIAVKISPIKMIKSMYKYIFGSIAMGIVAMILHQVNSSSMWEVFSICVCVIVYFGIILSSKSERSNLERYIKILKRRELDNGIDK